MLATLCSSPAIALMMAATPLSLSSACMIAAPAPVVQVASAACMGPPTHYASTLTAYRPTAQDRA